MEKVRFKGRKRERSYGKSDTSMLTSQDGIEKRLQKIFKKLLFILWVNFLLFNYSGETRVNGAEGKNVYLKKVAFLKFILT